MCDTVDVISEGANESNKRQIQQNDDSSASNEEVARSKQPRASTDECILQQYEHRMVVVYDPIKDTEKKKYGVQAHYNRARPLVVAAFEQFLEDDSEKLFFLEPVLVAGGVNYKTFYDNDWNRDRRMDHDGYFMTHELRDVVFDIHVGHTSPRQLRKKLFKHAPLQTTRYAVIVQVFPGDWGAAAVQWRRDEQHPEGFQLVAALDFGVGALSTAAKALYALEQPVDTHMPAVPEDRWVRHAVVADDTCATAFDTCCLEEFLAGDNTWRCEGVWYTNAHSPGTPKLFFDKAAVLLSPSIPDAQKEGQFEADLHLFFINVADSTRASDTKT